MATIICPGSDWVYKYNEMEESSSDYIIDDTTIISLKNTGSVKLFIKDFSPNDTLSVYNKFEDGISISDDNKLIINTKATSPPTFFKKFDLFIEDCNGLIATYSLDNNMIGKEEIILTKAFVAPTDFNASFIVKVGFIFSNPKSVRDFTFITSDVHTVYRVEPTYAKPEEVIEFLGMVDNKGNLFQLTDSSVPSYNAIAQRICESEEYLENACRDAWTERRVAGEIRNADSVWAASFGYLGILSADSLETGTQMFFKGIPVKLVHDHIQKIDYSKGDLVEVRRYGSEWTVVPEGAIWEDEAKGIIYIKTLFFQKDASVRVTYRYGHGPVPADIKKAVLLQTAMIIVGTDWYRQRFPQSPMFDPLKQETLSQWTWVIKDIIRNHTDLISCGSF